MTDDDSYQRGIARRNAILGSNTGQRTSFFHELAPDLERVVIENLWGGTYCRPGLEPRIRALCTVTLLAGLGHLQQVRLHIGGALNVGASKEEIVEALQQMMWYVGLPAFSSALQVANEVFQERGLGAAAAP